MWSPIYPKEPSCFHCSGEFLIPWREDSSPPSPMTFEFHDYIPSNCVVFQDTTLTETNSKCFWQQAEMTLKGKDCLASIHFHGRAVGFAECRSSCGDNWVNFFPKGLQQGLFNIVQHSWERTCSSSQHGISYLANGWTLNFLALHI